MAMLHPLNNGQTVLPGLASLALPLPFPATTPQNPQAPPAPQPPASAALLSTLPQAAATQRGVVAAPTSALGWQPQIGASVMWPQQVLLPLSNQPATSVSAPCQDLSRTTLLASMLQQLQQQQQQQQQPQQLQQRRDRDPYLPQQPQAEWHSSMMRQHMQPNEQANVSIQALQNSSDHGTALPAFISQHNNAQGQGSAARKGQGQWEVGPLRDLHTACSSRSSTSSTTGRGGDSQGSPNNSLSTLLACNEMLKSQLEQNELQIQKCRERAKASKDDADSNEGTQYSDDDSTNGTSCVSNASTTPSIKDAGRQVTGQSRYWTEEEHRKFLEAVRCFGAHNHKAIASYVSTRNSTQVRSHSQKFFKKLETFRGRGLPTMLRKRKNLNADGK
jgi:SHAQKYF class myb-like DNA-binding protein